MKSEEAQPCCKIARVADDYNISEIDAKLIKRREQGDSLRDLATYLNKQILSESLNTGTREVVGDADSIYKVLRGNDVSRSRQVELRSKLDRNGIDIEAVERDFVSHQTVRNHLHDCKAIDTGRKSTVDVDDAQKTIEWAQARSEGVIEQTLKRLRNAGNVADTPTEVTLSVRVGCSACGRTHRIEDYLEQGGCNCQTDPK
ncbi:rod-determining factor RdfA [Halorhabdus rudnickae]|uniref:rod-determining factor RdfA n=1 Tax=Halorhabdus rudnickae TaxID=1775544 RepID=UPI00108233C4|nr:rod-determining factor RdfA [Halorhabdus rudnickae]